MKIAINCWVLRNKQLDGIGYFSINSFQRIIKNNPEVSFVILCDKNFTENYFDFKNVELRKVFPPLRHPLLYIFYMEFVIPVILRKIKPDLFVSADGFLSLSSSCKQMPLICDLNFEHYPENIALKNRLYFKYFFKRFAKKADRIVTLSEYSKKDIVDFYNVPIEKVDNVSCGINSSFSVLSEQEKEEVKLKFSNGVPYFFFVGSLHPRKNVDRLIAGFEIFKSKTGSDFKLLIAGNMLWSKSSILDVYESSVYKADIIFTGRISDEELSKVLGAAYALSFVPVFEGFGLPLVEAFESGVPVISANVTSLPEVAGEAAVYVDPFDINSIGEAMIDLYEDKNGLRRKLIEKGFLQKQKFSWDKTAKLLWSSILKTIK